MEIDFLTSLLYNPKYSHELLYLGCLYFDADKEMSFVNKLTLTRQILQKASRVRGKNIPTLA